MKINEASRFLSLFCAFVVFAVGFEAITQGHFEFGGVPPGRLDLVRVIRGAGFGGWASMMQTWLVADPGVTNDMGKIIFDTPPPLPLTEQIKQKLGL